MLAYAFLAVLAAAEHANNPPLEGMILLTCNEIHQLRSATDREFGVVESVHLTTAAPAGQAVIFATQPEPPQVEAPP